MIICVCKRINTNQIMDAIDRGVTNVEQLTEQLGLGTGCGGCVEYTRDLVEQQSRMIMTDKVA